DAAVDLGAGTAGRPGEHDRVVNVENATGRSGSDRLVGDAAGNVLSFDGSLARGRGSLLGGAGNDTLVADNPRLVDAGAGDDRVGVTADATDAQVTCGPGSDRVFQSDRRTLLPTDCESIELPGEYLSAIEDEGDHTPIVVLIAGTVTTYPVRIAGGTATFLL